MAPAGTNLGLNHGAGWPRTPPPLPGVMTHDPAWKLYYNPHYLSRGFSCWSSSSRSPSSRCRRGGVIMERDGEEMYVAGGFVPVLSDQEQEQEQELEMERQILRVAEQWEEERVTMKLDKKLQEIADAGANADGSCKSSNSSSSLIGKSSPACQQSPTSGSGRVTTTVSRTGETQPAAARTLTSGAKGFVEFPRGARVRPREERVDLVSNLECQRAQLRVLMRHGGSPAAGMGVVGAAENLVV